MEQFDLSLALCTFVREIFGLNLDRTVDYRSLDHSLELDTGHDTHQVLPTSICQKLFPHNQSENISPICFSFFQVAIFKNTLRAFSGVVIAFCVFQS
jgi:hypothetical protein